METSLSLSHRYLYIIIYFINQKLEPHPLIMTASAGGERNPTCVAKETCYKLLENSLKKGVALQLATVLQSGIYLYTICLSGRSWFAGKIYDWLSMMEMCPNLSGVTTSQQHATKFSIVGPSYKMLNRFSSFNIQNV